MVPNGQKWCKLAADPRDDSINACRTLLEYSSCERLGVFSVHNKGDPPTPLKLVRYVSDFPLKIIRFAYMLTD